MIIIIIIIIIAKQLRMKTISTCQHELFAAGFYMGTVLCIQPDKLQTCNHHRWDMGCFEKYETSESGKPRETCEPGDSNGSGEGWWRHLPVVRGDLVLNEAVDEGANPLLTQTLAPNILLRSNFFQILASNIKYCHQIFYCALTFSTWMSRARLRLSREVNHRLAWLWPLKQ